MTCSHVDVVEWNEVCECVTTQALGHPFFLSEQRYWYNVNLLNNRVLQQFSDPVLDRMNALYPSMVTTEMDAVTLAASGDAKEKGVLGRLAGLYSEKREKKAPLPPVQALLRVLRDYGGEHATGGLSSQQCQSLLKRTWIFAWLVPEYYKTSCRMFPAILDAG